MPPTTRFYISAFNAAQKEPIMKKQSLYPAVVTGLFCAFLGCGALLSVLMPKKSFSETENRYLAQLPIFSWERLADGTFGTDYEKYLSDQFRSETAGSG